MIPEDYRELETYLNLLAGWLWKRILAAKDQGEVISLLRKHCPGDLHTWTDADLKEFFSTHPLGSFDPIDERF